MPTTRKNAVSGAQREVKILELEQEIANVKAREASTTDPVERAKMKLTLTELRYDLSAELRRRSRRKDQGQRPLPFQGQRPTRSNAAPTAATEPCPNCERLQRMVDDFKRMVSSQAAITSGKLDQRDAELAKYQAQEREYARMAEDLNNGQDTDPGWGTDPTEDDHPLLRRGFHRGIQMGIDYHAAKIKDEMRRR